MGEQLVVIGSGGHARSVVDAALNQGCFDVIGVLSPSESDWETYRGVEWIGSDADASRYFELGCKFAGMGIGFMGGLSHMREKLFNEYSTIGFLFPPVVDPSAIVSEGAELGAGSFVGKGAIVNANAHIGCCSIINSAALVEHDCIVSDFSHVAVGALLCGGVSIGRNVLVGAHATILQGLSVQDNAVIGAGTLILKDVPEGVRALGLFDGKD